MTTRELILKDLEYWPGRQSAKQVAFYTGCKPDTVRKELKKLVQEGLVKKSMGYRSVVRSTSVYEVVK